MISLTTGGIRNSRYLFLYNFMKILSLFVISVRIYIRNGVFLVEGMG